MGDQRASHPRQGHLLAYTGGGHHAKGGHGQKAAHGKAHAQHSPLPRTPEGALTNLKQGNERFVSETSIHPNTSLARFLQAGTENQGDHAYATVITCSDSRVPVERLFDAGVMDIFVIRVAGNVCDTDEVGSIEYGLAHVNTPVLVVLGHTQCGAVTAVTHAVQGRGHPLERNIPPLVDNIQPAVERTIKAHPHLHGDDVIPPAIVENVWQGIEDLFMSSPSTRNLVNSGRVKIVGAIYDVGTGKVRWLPESKTHQILASVESNPTRAMNAMADTGGHSRQSTHGASHSTGHSSPGPATAAAIPAKEQPATGVDIPTPTPATAAANRLMATALMAAVAIPAPRRATTGDIPAREQPATGVDTPNLAPALAPATAAPVNPHTAHRPGPLMNRPMPRRSPSLTTPCSSSITLRPDMALRTNHSWPRWPPIRAGAARSCGFSSASASCSSAASCTWPRVGYSPTSRPGPSSMPATARWSHSRSGWASPGSTSWAV
ncbi:MAG: carbonic anhydrase [Planctomycetes bacterium]|nr:carbonic anhydrase [Planctomycetota bacterium]